MIASFYKGFHSKVSEVVQIAEKVVGQRDLGLDPVSGKKVIVRIGPFGPMAQIGEEEDNESAPKPKFASLLKFFDVREVHFPFLSKKVISQTCDPSILIILILSSLYISIPIIPIPFK